MSINFTDIEGLFLSRSKNIIFSHHKKKLASHKICNFHKIEYFSIRTLTEREFDLKSMISKYTTRLIHNKMINFLDNIIIIYLHTFIVCFTDFRIYCVYVEIVDFATTVSKNLHENRSRTHTLIGIICFSYKYIFIL